MNVREPQNLTRRQSWGLWLREAGAELFKDAMEVSIFAGVAMEGASVLGQLNQEGNGWMPAGQEGTWPYYASCAGFGLVALGASGAVLGATMNIAGRILCPCLPTYPAAETEMAQLRLQQENLQLRVEMLEQRAEMERLRVALAAQAGTSHDRDLSRVDGLRHRGTVSSPAPPMLGSSVPRSEAGDGDDELLVIAC